MPIPDYQTLMLPLLRLASDGADHTTREAVEKLSVEFQLTQDERGHLLASGQQAVINNRIGWANSYLKKAGLLESPRRGVLKITKRGRQILEENPQKIDVKFLDRFPEFVEFRDAAKLNKESTVAESIAPPSQQTPEEALELANQSIRASLAQDILSRVLLCSPAFFEHLVVELLVKMGYGGSRKDAGERIGKSGDGGIDGIIKEDLLGLDTIYLQAKRWQGTVGRPEIQKFVGALQGQRARKGVFITTSSYTSEATEYASRIDTKVVLIDGQQLASLMIDFDVGVSVVTTYLVKRIDSDYFEDSDGL
ncbi:restriction endonuclease [Pseudoduganella lutea]|uniref:Restriction endonuclease n=1 Tax=Pseudoduganella lutea TaxID=321985 RepID=A0A4P6KWA5_9BURK|nr:restriction endonuclease [Pseudoduganella lutea]QBE63197.1 restriction endonuclease [Pseudoduganella lutea]